MIKPLATWPAPSSQSVESLPHCSACAKAHTSHPQRQEQQRLASALVLPAAKILWSGDCPKDTQFRLRLCPSASTSSDYARPSLVELVINNVYTIRMTTPWQFRLGAQPPRHPPTTFECSRAYFSAVGDGDDEISRVAEFHPGLSGICSNAVSISPLPDGTPPGKLIDQCTRLVLAVCENMLLGFFHIGAVRDRHDVEALEPFLMERDLNEIVDELKTDVAERDNHFLRGKLTSDDLVQRLRDLVSQLLFPEKIDSRYVGSRGEASVAMWRRFSDNYMYDEAVKDKYSFSGYCCFWLKKLLQMSIDESEFPSTSPLPSSLCGYLHKATPDHAADAPDTEGRDAGSFEHVRGVQTYSSKKVVANESSVQALSIRQPRSTALRARDFIDLFRKSPRFSG